MDREQYGSVHHIEIIIYHSMKYKEIYIYFVLRKAIFVGAVLCFSGFLVYLF